MKKLMVLGCIIVLANMVGFSQPFGKGSQAINLGIGFGNSGSFGTYYSGFLPSASASYEYGIVEIPMGSQMTGVVSAGAYVGWSLSKYSYSNWNSGDYYLSTDLVMGVRGNYHFIFHDQFDPYAGLIFGIDIQSAKWHSDGNDNDPGVDFTGTTPFAGIYAGARWFFTDSFGVYAEVGWLISVINAGVTFKIK